MSTPFDNMRPVASPRTVTASEYKPCHAGYPGQHDPRPLSQRAQWEWKEARIRNVAGRSEYNPT